MATKVDLPDYIALAQQAINATPQLSVMPEDVVDICRGLAARYAEQILDMDRRGVRVTKDNLPRVAFKVKHLPAGGEAAIRAFNTQYSVLMLQASADYHSRLLAAVREDPEGMAAQIWAELPDPAPRSLPPETKATMNLGETLPQTPRAPNDPKPETKPPVPQKVADTSAAAGKALETMRRRNREQPKT